jgi:hypothetical protein
MATPRITHLFTVWSSIGIESTVAEQSNISDRPVNIRDIQLFESAGIEQHRFRKLYNSRHFARAQKLGGDLLGVPTSRET